MSEQQGAAPPPDAEPGAQPAATPPPAAPEPAAASRAKDRGPRREPSGAEKRRKAKAKRDAGGDAGASSPSSTPKRPSAGAVLARELADIEAALGALLVAPAVPMAMAGDTWAAQHVEARGGALAHQVVELARRNPVFRAQLLKLMTVSENGQLAFAAAAYLVPLLIYYGLLPVPPPVRAQLQIPDRQVAREPAGPAFAAASGEAVPSADGPPAPGAHFTEQPPGTPGAPPAPGPPAAEPAPRAG